MSQGEGNIFNLSPLSLEKDLNLSEESIKSRSFPSSPTLSSRLSKASSISSINSFNYRKNPGSTPKKSLKIKNSLEVARFKVKNEPQIGRKKNAFTISSIQSSKENAICLDEKMIEIMSQEQNSSLIPLWPSGESKASSSLIPLSQFDLMPKQEKNSSSFLTVDEIFDSDVDMFEDCPSEEKYSPMESEESKQLMDLSPSKFLANSSCEYSVDKSKFESKYGYDGTNHLAKEIFDVSKAEIQEKLAGILEFLEDSQE